jgi:glycosyltransferase involved in cell wall biosynthesis
MNNATPEINQARPLISVVIPARNEENHLPGCLESLRQALSKAAILAEIVVVLNRCTDSTEAIAHQYGCQTVHCDAKNLAAIRNFGVRRSLGKWIVTVDADSKVSENMFVQIQKKLESGDCVGGGVAIFPERWSLGILLTGLCLVPYVLIYRIAGGLFFFTREAFDAIGGFDEQFLSVEDIDFAKRLKRHAVSQRKRFAILIRAYIITSTRKFDKLGDWYFLKRPFFSWRLLNNKDKKGADKIWYDFER